MDAMVLASAGTMAGGPPHDRELTRKECTMIERFVSTLESMKNFWLEAGTYLPSLLATGVVLLVGWLVARIARKAAIRILRLMRVDLLAEKVGIENFLLQGSVRYTTVTLLANFVYWLIMFTVILAALNSLGMQSAASLFNKVLLFIPNVVVAVLVLMFGAFFARIVRSISYTYLSNIGISGADLIGHTAQWAILLFAISIALDQLSIGGQLLQSAFQIGFGAVCLAFAIAFGLGGKEWAGQVIAKLMKHQLPR
jgi:hypothetical protein